MTNIYGNKSEIDIWSQRSLVAVTSTFLRKLSKKLFGRYLVLAFVQMISARSTVNVIFLQKDFSYSSRVLWKYTSAAAINSCHTFKQSFPIMWSLFALVELSRVDVTDGQSAYRSWCRAPFWGPWPHFSFAGQLLCSSSWGALSDERTDL
jgi:hypothetical protein